MVRLAHSADLRSRLRHVSSAPSVAYSTGCSRVVTHPGTNPARRNALQSVSGSEISTFSQSRFKKSFLDLLLVYPKFISFTVGDINSCI